MAVMKRLSDDSSTDRPALRAARTRLERVAVSVLLAIGAAVLIGWLFVKLYVELVTAD